MHADPEGSEYGSAEFRRRYAVGDFTLDVARRELTGPSLAEPYRLAPKTQQVLLALMERPGDVLTRDELLRKVWSGTLPTDYVLGQAITQLRKAFGDVRGHATYIETISKSGYRLCVNVAALEEPPAPLPAAVGPISHESAPAAPGNERAGRWTMQALVAACLIAVAAIAWLVYTRTDRAAVTATGPVAQSIERITSGLGDEVEPALSPDGAFVAYAMRSGEGSGFGIHVQAASATAPNMLTSPPPGSDDRKPRWSPDGKKLLFLRVGPSGCAVMDVPASGGPAATVHDCTGEHRFGFDWGPTAGTVVAGAVRAGSLRVLDLRSGKWRNLPYETPAGVADYNPHVSPDGKWIGFQRGISEGSLWRVPVDGGTARLVMQQAGNIMSWTWLANSKSVVLTTLGAKAEAVQVDVESGRQRTLPLAHVISVDAAKSGAGMALALESGRLGMLRYRLSARGPVGEPEPVFPSSGSDMQASPSPDGTQVAFYSDRTESVQLWFATPGEPRSLHAVEGFEPMTRHPPAWAPDGRSVWLVGAQQAQNTRREQLIHEVEVASGRVTAIRLGQANPVQVIPLANRQLLTIVDMGSGRLELWHVDLTSSPYRILKRMPSVGEIRIDPSGGFIHYVRSDGPGVRRMDIAFQYESIVDPAVPARYWDRTWLVTPAGVQGVVRVSDCTNLWSAPKGESPVDARCLNQGQAHGFSVQGVPTTDSAGRWLYLTHTLPTTGVDIGMTTQPSSR